jgi:hypothetical protein
LPNPSPSSTTPSVAVFVLAELVMLGVRRRREEARRSGPRSCGQTPGHTPLH